MADFRSRFPQERSAGARRSSPRSVPSILRRPGRGLLSCRRFVLSSTGRRWGKSSPGARPIDKRTSGPQDNSLPPLVPSATGARPFVLSSFRPVVDRPRMGEIFPRNPAFADSPSLPTPRSPARSAKPFLHAKVAKSAKTVEGAFLENRRTERNSSLRKTSRKSAHNQRTSGGHAAEIGTRRNKQ